MRRDDRGSVLLYVVWVMILLSLIAAGAGAQASLALTVSSRLSSDLSAELLLRGGAAHGAVALIQDRTLSADGVLDEWFDSPGLYLEHPLPGGRVSLVRSPGPTGAPRYGWDDESARLGLNTASAEVLQRLFQLAAGVKPEDAEAIAAAVIDWRDEDDKESPKGAENFYYHSLKHGYDCKNGPFEHPEELLLVRGVTPEIYRAVEPYVTSYGWGRVNLNTASQPVLQALGLSEAGVAGLRTYRGGENSIEGDSDDRQLLSPYQLDQELAAFVPKEDLTRLIALATDQTIASSSTAFRTTIEAHAEDGASMRAQCVMDRTGTIHLWSER